MRYWLAKYLLVSPIFHLFFRIEVVGRDHIPRRGGAIIASNHISAIDSVFVPLVIPRHVTFLAKAQFFAGRGFAAWVRRSFMGAMGQLAIDRSGGSASTDALGAGVAVLRAGRLVGIYPEGTRSPDGRLYRGRTGLARMVLAEPVPVIPVTVHGTDEVLPIGKGFPKLFRRVTVTFGEPLDFSRFVDIADDRFVLRSIMDELMRELARMSGREYVDVYASRRRTGDRTDAELAEQRPE